MSFLAWLRRRLMPLQSLSPTIPPAIVRFPEDFVMEPDAERLEALQALLEEGVSDWRRTPKRPLIYFFQFRVLTEAAFTRHFHLRRILESGESQPSFLHFAAKAHFAAALAGMIRGPFDPLPPEIEAQIHLVATLPVARFQRDGHRVSIITMPPPQECPEAYFVAIAERDIPGEQTNDSTSAIRYLTLELSPDGTPFLCECTPTGGHMHFSDRPRPDLEDFVEAVFQRLKAG